MKNSTSKNLGGWGKKIVGKHKDSLLVYPRIYGRMVYEIKLGSDNGKILA